MVVLEIITIISLLTNGYLQIRNIVALKRLRELERLHRETEELKLQKLEEEFDRVFQRINKPNDLQINESVYYH